jgi:DNA-binding GntR family transcriptional regulator
MTMEAIRARDGERAAACMRAHIANGAETLVDRIQEIGRRTVEEPRDGVHGA